jgi:hypothetical protein
MSFENFLDLIEKLSRGYEHTTSLKKNNGRVAFECRQKFAPFVAAEEVEDGGKFKKIVGRDPEEWRPFAKAAFVGKPSITYNSRIRRLL